MMNDSAEIKLGHQNGYEQIDIPSNFVNPIRQNAAGYVQNTNLHTRAQEKFRGEYSSVLNETQELNAPGHITKRASVACRGQSHAWLENRIRCNEKKICMVTACKMPLHASPHRDLSLIHI